MSEQKNLERILTLIRELNTPPPKDVPQLIRRTGISKTRTYEYLKLLERMGYQIKTDEQYRKSFEFLAPKSGKGALGSDELAYLQDLIQKFGTNDLHAQNILHKFDLNLSLIPLADALPQLHKGRIIQLIRTAINTGSCLLLRNYRSLTSNTVENRLVEPMEITEDTRYLIAWDTKKAGQRQFKLDRIEEVDILDEKVKPGHVPSPMDIFGLTGDGWSYVTLKLENTAHHLLLEEFPLSQAFIRKKNKAVFFEGPVRDWKGIGRFVLGLPGEIEVIGPPAFKHYLEGKIKKF